MVEQRNLITLYFGKFESPYIGSPFLISGNQIYSAIIREKGMNETEGLKKISHGVFHTILPESINHRGKVTYNKKDWKGFPVGDKINISNTTMKTYDDFFQLRNYNTPFAKDTNGNYEYDRIMRHHRLSICSGDKIDLFHADRLSFFTVGNHGVDIENLQLGAKRNLGFGMFSITNKYSFDLESLDFSIFNGNENLINTAKNGICGILNHAKYGYGEFRLDGWVDDKWLIKLTSPLCLESTIEGSRCYNNPPPFMKNEGYRKHIESIWRKGKPEKLYCVSDGNVFLYENN